MHSGFCARVVARHCSEWSNSANLARHLRSNVFSYGIKRNFSSRNTVWPPKRSMKVESGTQQPHSTTTDRSFEAADDTLQTMVSEDGVAGMVGSTPLVRLNRIAAQCKAKVYAKMEGLNPGGSVKDRIAVQMIRKAEEKGLIRPGESVLVEATSGNTGVGLAMVAASMGYKLIVCMPRTPNMTERYMLCRAYGATIELTDPADGAEGFIAKAESIAASTPNAFLLRQFANPDNPRAHWEGTGREIWDSLRGQVDVFVAGAGTGGTVVGAGGFLKERNPGLHLVCVEAAESRVLQGAERTPEAHGLIGISAGVTLPFVDALAPGQPYQPGPRGIIDEFLGVASSAGVAMAKRLAFSEGLLVGPSSGAACAAALEVGSRDGMEGKTVVVVFPSNGERYLQHPMFDRIREDANRELPWCNWCSPENWR